MESPLARKRLRDLANLDVPLRDWAVNATLGDSWTGAPRENRAPVLGFLVDMGQKGWGFLSNHTSMFSVALMLLVAGVVVATFTHGLFRPAPVAPPQVADKAESSDSTLMPPGYATNQPHRVPAADSASGPIAMLAATCGALWTEPGERPAVGTRLAAGRELHLAAGVVALEFPIGVQAILQGPAKVKFVTGKQVELLYGKLTVKATRQEAHGFEIVTPRGCFVDQGTEFGVEVTPGGSSKVHVFQGLVDAKFRADHGRPTPSPSRLTENTGARLGSDDDGMTLVQDTGECFVRSMSEADRDRHVVAYWRFEDRPVGILLPDTGNNHQPVCASVDSSFNGNDLYVGNSFSQPMFSDDVAAASVSRSSRPNRSCLDTSQPIVKKREDEPFWRRGLAGRNVYTHSEFSHAAPLDIQRIAPAQWTIEASVKAARVFGKAQGFLGRDTNFTADKARAPARLTFQINARQRFAIGFYDADDRFHEAVAEDLPVEAGRWYHLAATSDGRMLRLYVDVLDGGGYIERAATVLPADGSTALGKGKDDAEWSIGRAGNEGDAGDWPRFLGWIDEIRVSDIARQPREFLFAKKDKE